MGMLTELDTQRAKNHPLFTRTGIKLFFYQASYTKEEEEKTHMIQNQKR
jgi:hypothetical protein